MTKHTFDVEQIQPDAVLIIIRGEFTRFASLTDAQQFRGHLEEVSARVGKPIFFFDHSLGIEQLNDQKLAALGLQRIKD
ncbi:hypothetical protein CDG60_12320 [Acinetobacter chinensis]|uniref:Uncharacterized protein n=1 Tax=Acinetobacter chinensis TaxID=2004650 RepID=A0A3B7LWX6_9GAMM|nr:hypothetical protein [Acinetobacter chinensis]AXY57282.1 hypothetical protein CDG60_12320 [Acinetobacter chinensis]